MEIYLSTNRQNSVNKKLKISIISLIFSLFLQIAQTLIETFFVENSNDGYSYCIKTTEKCFNKYMWDSFFIYFTELLPIILFIIVTYYYKTDSTIILKRDLI